MPYIALQRLKMADGTERLPGERVPEADKWADPMTWVRTGYVAFVRDGDEAQFLADAKAGKDVYALAPGSVPDYIRGMGQFLKYHDKGKGEAPATPAPKAEAAPATTDTPAQAGDEDPWADKEEDTAQAAVAKPARKRATKNNG